MYSEKKLVKYLTLISDDNDDDDASKKAIK